MIETRVWLNPLDLFRGGDPSFSDDTLQFMCPPGVTSDAESLRLRHLEITQVQPLLFAPPDDNRILNQLVWPLRSAKASYVVGNYLGTIALAGIVAEMTAILTFELIGVQFNQRPLTHQDEKSLFGFRFEKLGQARRLEVLKLLGVPTDEYEQIRTVRNNYLHLAPVVDAAVQARDARDVFRDAVTVVARTIGQDLSEGKMLFTPQMVRYLERMGSATRPVESPPTTPDAEEPGQD